MVAVFSSCCASIPRRSLQHTTNPTSLFNLNFVLSRNQVKQRTISSFANPISRTVERSPNTSLQQTPSLSTHPIVPVVRRFSMSTRSSRRLAKVAAEEAEDVEAEASRSPDPGKSAKPAPKAKVAKRKATQDVPASEEPVTKKKAKAAKATAKDKLKNQPPLAERTPIASLKKHMYIGAHVSGAGGEQAS